MVLISRISQRLYYWKFDLQSVNLEQIIPTIPDLSLDLHNWHKDLGAGPLFDTVTLAIIARSFSPDVCFEIGTGDGRSASIIAANTPPSSVVHTLDPEYPQNPIKGSVFRDQPEAEKIVQHSGFSDSFDFSPWFADVDLVFIDGAHDFESVLNDSEVAFRLIRRGGIILWHDLASYCPSVFKAIRECSRRNYIAAISGTVYGIYVDSMRHPRVR